jgi:hypothetical protein
MSDYDDQTQWAGGDQPAAEPLFALADNPGLSVSVDEDDNEAGHAVLHVESGVKVAFTVLNASTAVGSCTVDIYVDGDWAKSWSSSDMGQGGSESVELRGLGRFSDGYHEFAAYVTPGLEGRDQVKNNVGIDG